MYRSHSLTRAASPTRLLRYSAAIERLTYITTWWAQLSDIEQADIAKLHKMIMACEGEVEREREAWLSTSMATKMLAEAGEEEEEKKDGKGEQTTAEKAAAAAGAASPSQ